MRSVPIFPLPETVFFPETVLPLHLFEPRYRQMGQDAIEGGGELVVVLLKPGWESNYEGTPPVHDIATLGTIADHEELEDGRYSIVLEGSQRVRLLPPADGELAPGKLYRWRRIVPARERQAEPDRAAPMMQALRARWDELLEKSARSDPSAARASFEGLVNHISSLVDVPPRLKQMLLEEDDLLSRAGRLEAYLEEQLKFWRTLSRYRGMKPEDPSVN